jgi:hypothetical protein
MKGLRTSRLRTGKSGSGRTLNASTHQPLGRAGHDGLVDGDDVIEQGNGQDETDADGDGGLIHGFRF